MKSGIAVLVIAGTSATAAIPASAGAQDLRGAVGGVVSGTTEQVAATLDQVLGGAQGVLPADTLGDVLVSVAAPGAEPGAPGTAGASGPAGAGGASGATVVHSDGGPVTAVTTSGGVRDRRAPRATVRVLSRLSQVARTRRLRVQVRSDEAGVVAFSSTIRPGIKRRAVAKTVAHKRSVIHVPAVVLAFRRPGALTVELRISAADAARLGRSRNGRMSVGLLTADVARNQMSERLKRHLRR